MIVGQVTGLRLAAGRAVMLSASLAALMLSGLAVGCQSVATGPSAFTRTPTPPIFATPTPTNTPPPTPDQPEVITLTIWWPDRLAPPENVALQDALAAQIAQFEAANDDVRVELRLKRAQDQGGVMASLRAAGQVAPGALPDLTLLRREDLAEAAQTGLIVPLEGRVASGVLADLYDPALQLGWVNGELYGLNYMLDLQVLAYNAGALSPDVAEQQSPWSWGAVLDAEVSLAFQAVRGGTLSDLFLMHYRSAGGALPVTGDAVLNQEALLAVLLFYERLLDLNAVNRQLLELPSGGDYASALLRGDVVAAVVPASALASLAGANPQLAVTTPPTADGDPATVLSGWHWVMVAQGSERQAWVAQFINWMMNTERQGQYAELAGFVPSQRTALRQRPFAWIPTESLERLIAGSIPTMSADANNPVVRAMYAALLSVLSGDLTAEAAVAEAVAQLRD